MSSVPHTVPLEGDLVTAAGPQATSLPVRLGAWAFRQRSWLPLPLGVVLLTVERGRVGGWGLFVAGLLVVLVGEGVRFWSVRHIGSISRTRSATRFGPLVTTGPFQAVRNPLYAGNWLIWTGLVLASGLLWMLPVVWTVFALQHGVIVRWEEASLLQRFGEQYEVYCRAVPRWCPNHVPALGWRPDLHAWREVIHSERGSLLGIAVAAGLVALSLSF